MKRLHKQQEEMHLEILHLNLHTTMTMYCSEKTGITMILTTKPGVSLPWWH